MPAYDSARPATSSGDGGADAFGTSSRLGSGPLPTTKANDPFVSWPSTAETAVHATVYPPSPIGLSPALDPFGSSEAVVVPRSQRTPFSSRTSMTVPF